MDNNPDTSQQTLRLPEGYTIEPYEHQTEQTILVLKRPDGSPVAGFEFSAIGPGPKAIYNAAWEDADQHPAESRQP